MCNRQENWNFPILFQLLLLQNRIESTENLIKELCNQLITPIKKGYPNSQVDRLSIAMPVIQPLGVKCPIYYNRNVGKRNNIAST